MPLAHPHTPFGSLIPVMVPWGLGAFNRGDGLTALKWSAGHSPTPRPLPCDCWRATAPPTLPEGTRPKQPKGDGPLASPPQRARHTTRHAQRAHHGHGTVCAPGCCGASGTGALHSLFCFWGQGAERGGGGAAINPSSTAPSSMPGPSAHGSWESVMGSGVVRCGIHACSSDTRATGARSCITTPPERPSTMVWWSVPRYPPPLPHCTSTALSKHRDLV